MIVKMTLLAANINILFETLFLLSCVHVFNDHHHLVVRAEDEQSCASDRTNDDAKLLDDVIAWAKSNGAYINPKVEVKPIVGNLSGIFAKEAMVEGEIVSTIPWDIIIKPSDSARGICAAVEEVLKTLRKDPANQTPYEKYLASRPKSFHPVSWSEKGRKLLNEMIGDLPPKDDEIGPERILEMYDCDEWDLEDDLVLQALMLVMTRTEGPRLDHLVPFNDLINHKNGHGYTADPKFELGEHYQIVTRRDVEAGEEIRNSYNQCEWCEAFSNSPSERLIFLTPMIYEHYGFVESYPQRWIVPKFRILFDVEEVEGEEGVLNATWAVPPSPLGVDFLRSDINRLEAFADRLDRANSDLSEVELNGLKDYHKSILAAYKIAYDTSLNQSLSDEVWYLGRDYWWHEDVMKGANADRKPSSSSEPIRRYRYSYKERKEMQRKQSGYHSENYDSPGQ